MNKVTPHFPSNPPVKMKSCQSPFFKNLLGDSTSPQLKGGGGGEGAQYVFIMDYSKDTPILGF